MNNIIATAGAELGASSAGMKINHHRFGSGDRYTEAQIGAAFMTLAAVEPELYHLAEHIDRVMANRKPNFDADSNLWYIGPYAYKKAMSQLVGWKAKNPKLRTMEAYDIGYGFLYFYLIEERLNRKVTLREIADASLEWQKAKADAEATMFSRINLAPLTRAEVGL